MNVLVTGGFGYLGGRLIKHLTKQSGYEILLSSRKYSAPPEWSPLARVAQMDWCSDAELDRVCTGIDAVVHLAGMNAQDCTSRPDMALQFNGVATAKLLQAAIRGKVKRFIHLSTAHVYAAPLTGLITEESCPANLHPYATSHRAGEDVVRSAHLREEIDGVVMRLSNAYGAPVHKDVNCWMLLVNDLCHQAVTTRKMVLKSAGFQNRDFISLSDTCSAIEYLLNLSSDQLGDGLYNVGGQTSRVIEMAKLIQSRCLAVLGFNPEIIRPESNQREASSNLDYCTAKLLATGFSLEGDSHGEIDALLHLCNDLFGGSE